MRTIRRSLLVLAALGLTGVLAFVCRSRATLREEPAAPQAVPAPASAPPAPLDPRGVAIKATAERIRAECQRNAGGDWDRWLAQLRPYQDDLRARCQSARPHDPTATACWEARGAVLEARDGFPLVECVPDHYVRYIYEPESLDACRRDGALVAGSRWLRRRGIDVLCVVVPKMVEVYPEHFAAPCPQDRVVAPQVRRLLLELLESDVEVVDLLPVFLAEREKDPEPLYQPADPHWAPRGQRVAAREIAARLRRYDFVARALAGPPVFQTAEVPYRPASQSPAFAALNPAQQERAALAQPKTYLAVTGGAVEAPDAPVAIIGDSYNLGLADQVAREINMPVCLMQGSGQTTQAFKRFLREPETLQGRKVVIWLFCATGLQKLAPLPERVVREADE